MRCVWPLPVALLLTWVTATPLVRRIHQTDYWGPWGEWGECSRTCGIGVTFRERRCYSNRKDDGSSCVGPERDYHVCNIQDCPEGSRDFREEQCSVFDGTDFQGKRYKWRPYYGASNKCELNCIPQGENFYYRQGKAVRDGTLCEPGNRHICIQGVCKVVGCDNTLGSSQTEDKCLECGGDGSSCSEVRGTFVGVDLPKGYNQIHIIPIGATSIRVREVRPTRNFLAVKNVRGEYYLNGDWTIDYSRALHVASTVLQYERGSEGDLAPELLHGRGPTTEPLILEIISQEPNLGVEYQYFQSRYRKQPQGYYWSVGSWSVCSKECGIGFQTRLVFCTIDNEAYPYTQCQGQARPSSSRTCNPQTCPRTKRWQTGEWSTCSVTCGGGVQSRPVYCSLSDGTAGEAVQDDAECSGLSNKPPSRQACNLLQCASWHTGHWSQCSVTCGEGLRTRTVSCVSPSRSPLPDFVCSSQSRPDDGKACVLENCPEAFSWYIGAWGSCSVTCGEGVQIRPVSCMSQLGGQLQDSICSSQTKPFAVQTCVRGSCGHVYSWHVGAWGLCSKSCGSGRRKRQVICYNQHRNHQDPSQCNPRRFPHEMEECNTQPCYLPQAVPSFPDPTGFDPDNEWMTIPFVESIPASERFSPEFLPDRAETNLLPVPSAPHGSDPSRFYHHISESDSPDSGPFSNPSRSQHVSPQPGQLLLDPEVWDCNAQPYGCCPDGYAAARGPGGAGCPLIPCYKSRYGCCPDGVTSARGFNHISCPRHLTDKVSGSERMSESRVTARNSPSDQCRSSMYGCCQDESSLALGPNGQGCSAVPGQAYPTRCLLPSANGPCTDWSVRWFFEPGPGACNRFWYGGCHGNQNNFESEEQCLQQCKRTDFGSDFPTAPAEHPHWWTPHADRYNQPEPLPHQDPSPTPPELPVYSRLRIDRSDGPWVQSRPGATAQLPCRVDASPSLRVEWHRNGQPIYSLRHSQRLDGSLEISRVRQEDAGVYTCHASNGRDQDFLHVELMVQAGELRITEPPQDVTVGLGGRAELHCRVSDARAHVQWTRNGIPVRADSEHASVTLDGTLILHNIQLGDSGTYTCNAYSDSRSVSARADLTVTSTERATDPPALDPLCVDLPELANCDLVIQADLCSNQYYASFCCSSCSKHQTFDQPQG